MTNKTKIIAIILYMFIVAPIWVYLLYKILEYVEATELMWLLYWIYVPVAIISSILIKVSEED